MEMMLAISKEYLMGEARVALMGSLMDLDLDEMLGSQRDFLLGMKWDLLKDELMVLLLVRKLELWKDCKLDLLMV